MNEKIPETLILIQGEPEYELIDACGDCSFWYSPAAKKKYALLSMTITPPLFPIQKWELCRHLWESNKRIAGP